jgi:dihydroorotase-like cyclic amidohydrolase
MVDTLIKNAKIVSPENITDGNIAIENGKVAAIITDASLPEAKDIIDAEGKYVIPGVIDPHIHYGVYHSGEEEIEDLQCAAYGGTTTACSFVSLGATAEKGSYEGVFEKWVEVWEQNAVLDTIFHGGMCSEKNIEDVVTNAERVSYTQGSRV